MKIDAMKIRLLLAEQEKTQAEIEERLGLKRSSVSRILKQGSCEPQTLGRLARGLGVNPSELLDTGRE